MVTKSEDKPVEKKAEKKALELEIATRIAAGILSSANVSHREPAIVADLAIKQARAIMDAVEQDNA